MRHATPRSPDYLTLKAWMAVDAGGDPYGWGMSWWFAIAGRLHEDGVQLPASWHYRPSPFGGGVLENFEDHTLADLSLEPAALLRMGEVLSRYIRACKHKGLDY